MTAMPERPNQEKRRLFDNPRTVKLLIYALCAICAALLALDFVVHRHSEHPIESWYGFYPIYGFVCCALLVLGAKELRKLLQRGEDYYDD